MMPNPKKVMARTSPTPKVTMTKLRPRPANMAPMTRNENSDHVLRANGSRQITRAISLRRGARSSVKTVTISLNNARTWGLGATGLSRGHASRALRSIIAAASTTAQYATMSRHASGAVT